MNLELFCLQVRQEETKIKPLIGTQLIKSSNARQDPIKSERSLA